MLRSVFLVCFAFSFIGQFESIPVNVQQNGRIQIEWTGPIEQCNDEPNLNICLSHLTQKLRPLVLKAMEESGHTDLNQIKVGTVKYDQTQGPVTVNVVNKNIKVSGVPNYSLIKIKFNTNENTINFSYELPVLRVESNYKIAGKAFFFPIKGSGPMYLELRGIKAEGKMSFYKTENEQGQQVLQAKELTIEYASLKDINARIRGLFDGNPLLSAAAHYFINTYGSEVFELLKPDISKYTEDIVKNAFFNPLLSKLPELSEYVPNASL